MGLLDRVVKLLSALGFETGEDDAVLLEFSVLESEMRVKNYCNVDELSDELIFIAVKYAAGYFLSVAKRPQAPLSGSTIKSISEGDTSITYVDGLTDEERLGCLIEKLTDLGEADRYRRIEW